MDTEIIVQALWLIVPAYTANASAVIVGGGTPIDQGEVWKDGNRLLGDGKTWRGLVAGAFLGVVVGFAQVVAARYMILYDANFLGLSDFEGFPLMIPLIFSLCFGALMGDTSKSFLKRRIGKKRGEDWLIFDQLDFIVGSLFLCWIVSIILNVTGALPYNWFYHVFSMWHILVIVVVTPFVHILVNAIHDKVS